MTTSSPSSSHQPPATILFAHSSDELYGSDVVLLELVRRLDPARFRAIVAMPTDVPYQGKLSQALAETGVAHRSIDMPVLRRRYLSAKGLPGFLRRLRHNNHLLQPWMTAEHVVLVHSNTSAAWGGALAARKMDIPHLWHVHELVDRPRLVRKLIAAMIGRYSDHVVAISQAVADHLLADQPRLASRLSVIYDAVDVDRFHPDQDGTSLRQMWGVSSEDVLVGVVGRISAWKGQAFFLQAVARAAAAAPSLKAVIVGDVVPGEGWRRDELVRLSQTLGIGDRVVWAGYSNQAPQVMAALDILALPSIKPEPFGMVIIEAMATERPVVATAHGGPLETVVDGETGYLVLPGAPEAMADALIRLAAEPELRRRLGHRARIRACERFTFQRHVDAFQQIYTQLLAKSSKP